MTEKPLTPDYPSSFSPALIEHCRRGFVPPQVFYEIGRQLSEFPRYVRLRPTATVHQANDSKEVVEEQKFLADALGTSVESVRPVVWLPHCYAIPRRIRIHGLPLYTSGRMVPMDVASLAAVLALEPQEGEIVLDLCCAPAMKLGAIAERVGPSGAVVGVDLSVDRLYVARSVLMKMGNNPSPLSVLLFAADGCRFDWSTGQRVLDDTSTPTRVKVRGNGLTVREERRLQSKRQREGQPVTSPPIEAVVYAPLQARNTMAKKCQEKDGFLFDRVLVDAECTHDGSIAHLDLHDGEASSQTDGLTNLYRTKHINIANESTPNVTKSVPDLQLQLLLNGYAQLKEGGTLIYCTCSFSFLQNEGVLLRFMEQVEKQSLPKAKVLPAFAEVSVTDEAQKRHLDELQTLLNSCQDHYEIVSNGLRSVDRLDCLPLIHQGLLGSRFDPLIFQCSFQYIVKILKLKG